MTHQKKSSDTPPTPRSVIVALTGGLLLLNLFVISLIGLGVQESRRQHEERGRITTQNLAKVLEQDLADQIGKIDLALLMLAQKYTRQQKQGHLDGATVQDAISDIQTRLPEIGALSVSNAAGDLTATIRGVPSFPLNIADREYFSRLKDQADDSLLIARPVISRVTGQWVLIFARRVNEPDGSFAGAIYGGILLERLQQQFSALDIGKEGMVTLRDSKLNLITRFPMKKPLFPDVDRATVSPKMQASLETDRQSGTYVGTSALDHIERMVSYRQIANLPLIILVGLSREEYLSGWYADLIKGTVLAFVFLVISTLAARLILHSWQRQLATLDQLSRGEERLRMLAENASDTISRLEKQADAQIEFLAHHDPLTGLPNRLLGKDRMEVVINRVGRSRGKAALLFLDLDHFKKVNDSLGYPIGDELLKLVAARLIECLHETDTLCRQGGDEFLVLMSDIREAEAASLVAETILACLGHPFVVDGHDLYMSASIGIAVFPDDGNDFDTLFQRADIAMYHAKEMGRNAYRFFAEQMNVDSSEYLRLRNGLRRALERNELLLHYQPQFDLLSGKVIGVEALIRWNHPEFGIVPPARFIPVAEESGLIVPIGTWVLNEACRQAAAWRDAGLSGLVMAVNLSAAQFKRGDLLQTVTDALAASTLQPDLLELELTESILISDTAKVLATVDRLKELGVKLSIDDFGTGYSCLAYLKRFRVDRLKIDQSFVRHVTTDANDAAIIQAIVQLARSLGLRTVAEGVETEPALRALISLGCDDAQGYYFAKPMSAPDVENFLLDTTMAPARQAY